MRLLYGFGLPKGPAIATFPVKHNWREKADLELIRRSCQELREGVLKSKADGLKVDSVIIPRPGVGNGKLDYADVRPILEEELPEDIFKVITWRE